MTYYYTVFGLTIQSEIPLVAFQSIQETTRADILIKTDTVNRPAEHLADAVYGDFLTYHPSFCYLTLPENQGALSIQKFKATTEVTLDFKTPKERPTLLAYFYGTGLSAILQMRGQFALHASGVVVNNSLCLFCGASGMGKSTLAASLKSRGYPLFTDDKCVLYQPAITHRWMAYPSLQIMRLWEDAAASVATESFLTNPIPVISNREKHQYQIKSSDQITTPLPLKSIYILSKSEEDEPSCQLLHGVEKMRHLQAQVFRRFMVKGFQQELVLWNFINRLAADIAVYLIKRPVDLSIMRMGDFVEHAIIKH